MRIISFLTLCIVLTSCCNQSGDVIEDTRCNAKHLIDDNQSGEQIVSPWIIYESEKKNDETIQQWLGKEWGQAEK